MEVCLWCARYEGYREGIGLSFDSTRARGWLVLAEGMELWQCLRHVDMREWIEDSGVQEGTRSEFFPFYIFWKGSFSNDTIVDV